jgi:4-amino-4-deoxy-L-arabinose transferase-like glycosyltransferase
MRRHPPVLSREVLLLAAIMIAAAVLRFANLDTVRFNIDHAYPIWQALNTLDTGALPVVGQASSVLFANPALTGYLYLPVVAITRSPLAVYIVVIALNTLAVAFTYFAARTALESRRLALVAAWLIAFNPWIIEYSRATWVQGLLPFWMALLAWLLFPVLLGKSAHPERRVIAGLVVLALLTQTYLLAFFTAAVVSLLLLIFRRRVPLRGALIGGAGLALFTGVYAFGLLNNSAAFQRAGNFSANPASLSAEALTHALRLVTGADYAAARSADQPDAETWIVLENVVQGGLLLLLIAGLVAAVLALRSGQRRDTAIILLLWYLLPIAAMSYTGNPVHPFYQLLGLPAGAILAARGGEPLLRNRVTAFLLAAFLLFAAVVVTINLIRAADSVRQTPGQNAILGLPLSDVLELGRAINRTLPTGGQVYSSLDPYVLTAAAGRLFPISSEVSPPNMVIIPQSGGLYIALSESEHTPPPGAQPGPRLPLVDGYTLALDLYPAGSIDLSTVEPIVDIRSEEGLRLYGYALEQRQADRWTLTTYWRVDAAAPLTSTDAFGPFVHVYDADGERIANVGGTVVPGYLWHVGDIHLHRMRFRAAAPFTLEVGQYDANSQQNMIFIDDAGNYSPTVSISP